ncbi:hypothetical protein BDY19DRAFT_499462 [Irpex rosettiformis]|uniref:Uncharacterized protein n=1 Tax=Irpex rosettiformis TaxID=378272 RepID=A0ACB8UEH3_9APHY|nr:hypothetical protein BDY19DRAFT_499462 [Irpex rosettiformis]
MGWVFHTMSSNEVYRLGGRVQLPSVREIFPEWFSSRSSGNFVVAPMDPMVTDTQSAATMRVSEYIPPVASMSIPSDPAPLPDGTEGEDRTIRPIRTGDRSGDDSRSFVPSTATISTPRTQAPHLPLRYVCSVCGRAFGRYVPGLVLRHISLKVLLDPVASRRILIHTTV